MKRPKIFCLVILLYALPLISVSQPDAMASEPSRWGVTTRKSLEKQPNSPLGSIGSDAEPAQPNRETNAADSDGSIPSDKGDKRPEPAGQNAGGSKNPGKTEHPASVRPNAETVDLKSTFQPAKKNGPDKKKPAPAAKQDKPSTKAIAWADEQQKKTCQTNLDGLRELFLKTRHYSIQGAPCKTNEFATAFLRLSEKSEQNCPAGFLNQKGYTKRIIRNITYLEKLGRDRCDSTEATFSSTKAK